MKKKSNDQDKSALNVNKGIEQPSALNEKALQKFRLKKKKKLSPEKYVSGILAQDRMILSQAITLIESSLPADQELSREIIEQCLPHSGKSIRVGITGVPGVGKSTFIETLGSRITVEGHKLAVLAIDPSSERSKGSILGDKTRMETLSANENAYIRPSPSAGSLGGVARKTRESIILCEAAGYDVIFVETVGVGQSETAVHSMVDFFLLLMLAGAGDELQGIKRGIMEMADAIAITKADKPNIEKARLACREYQNALHLFPPSPSGWTPKVLTCSAVEKQGISEIWDSINEYAAFVKENGFFDKKRQEQAKFWMYETINAELKKDFYEMPAIKEKLKLFEDNVLNKKMTSFFAAKTLLNEYLKHS